MMGSMTNALAKPEQPKVRPDTWAAVDGLGRTVSDYGSVGEPRKNKFVGVYFWTWHNHFAGSPARNLSQLIAANPEARNDFDHPAWGGTPEWTPFFWNEPIFGYYRTTDRYVIRKQAELLADAGVDVIFFDCTNDTYIFKDAYRAVFQEFQEAKEDGVNVPKIAFTLNLYSDANAIIQMKDIYNDIYKEQRYQDLWFYWEGKPLMMARHTKLRYGDPLEKEMKEFFTFRTNSLDRTLESTAYEDHVWGWISTYPQTKYGVRKDGSVEEMCVSTAQNATAAGETVAMNDYLHRTMGRGHAVGDYSYQYTYAGNKITVNQNTQNAYLYGLNFQQQWDYVMEVDPDFVFVSGWNEFVGQRLKSWKGTESAFSDNFTDEFSRDIEPTKGILKDHFYYQLVENIRRFKGVSMPDVADDSCAKTIDLYSADGGWEDVGLSFNHYTGSTQARKSAGYRGLNYKYDTMRNDIVTSKVAYDDTYIYFMVETKDDLTQASDPAWMRLLIDTDPTGVSSNWEGFEYILNRVSPTETEAIIERSLGGWNFEEVGRAKFFASGKRLQMAVPRKVLGLTDSGRLSFNFKWADNTLAPETASDSGDILDYYLYGDVAPGGRFMFTFTTQIPKAPVKEPKPERDNSYGWWMAGGGMLLAAAGGAGATVLARKRRKNA